LIAIGVYLKALFETTYIDINHYDTKST